MSNQRSRNFSLITYHSQEVIESVLCSRDVIRHWCYIIHDKDKKENSEELKEKHYHILINLNNAMTETALQKLFPVGQSTLSQIMRDKSNCFNYLTHADRPDKYQYQESELVSDDIEYWKGLSIGGDDNEKVLNILNDIMLHVPLREMAKRYGRDVVINYSKYASFATCIEREERIFRVENEVVDLLDDNSIRLVDLRTGVVVKKYKPNSKA